MSKENTDSKTTDGETKPVDTSVPNATSTNAELAEETVNKVAAAVTTSLTTSVTSDSTDGTTKEPESSWFGGCCGLKSDKAVDGKKTTLAPGSKDAGTGDVSNDAGTGDVSNDAGTGEVSKNAGDDATTNATKNVVTDEDGAGDKEDAGTEEDGKKD